jgi:peptidoglycan DL-endopeptidase CwlO
VQTAPAIRRIVRRRVAIVTAPVFVGGLLLGITGSAGAAPTPTVAQVQQKIKQLDIQLNRLGQQYDQVQQELSSTHQQLKVVNAQLADNSRKFRQLQAEIERIAITAYEDGGVNTSIALLTSGNPQQILDKSSILLELSNNNDDQIGQFLAEARQLTQTQELSRRTDLAIQQLAASLAKRHKALEKMSGQEEHLLSDLSPNEAAGLSPGGSGTSPGNEPTYNGPTTTQAEKAVKFAYDQLGCPYVYGGTGPCADGFDCSGLTMEAWAAAGVTIPRTSYEQWDDLPHVSLSDLKPGDILVFLDAGHVGIYVGDNKLIDAPQTGEDVELVDFSGWYTANVDGAVVP